MNSKHLLAITGLALSLGAGNAFAQDLDNTIRAAGDAHSELPAAITDPITLPGDVSEDSEAVLASEDGLKKANEARTRREDGLEMADEARATAADYADSALENAENASRGNDFVPETQDTPDVPDVPTGG